jgi:hypothetical protein
VVGHPVEQDAEAPFVRCGQQPVERGQPAETRVDVAVVGDVVAAVDAGARVDRRQPERVDTEPGQVVEPCGDPVEVAGTGTGRVQEGPGIDLVHDA